MMKFVFDRVENIVGKEKLQLSAENTGYQHFPQCFPKAGSFSAKDFPFKAAKLKFPLYARLEKENRKTRKCSTHT